MGYQIPPSESPSDGWTYNGTDWVKCDDQGVEWIWDGDEYAVIDVETNNLMVERGKQVYLKDRVTREIIASENPEDGHWIYGIKYDPSGDTLSSAPLSSNRTIGSSIQSMYQQQGSQLHDQANENRIWEKYVAAGLLDGKPLSQLYYSTPDGSMTLIKNPGGMQKYYEQLREAKDLQENVYENIRQIQHICKGVIRAAHKTKKMSIADQVLVSVSVTLLDLFDPTFGEITKTGAPLNGSLVRLLNDKSSGETSILAEPMKQRLKSIINTRLTAAMIRLNEISNDKSTPSDDCIHAFAVAFKHLLSYTKIHFNNMHTLP